MKRYRVKVPGRSEVAGNHVDHQGGSVIAAAINRMITCEASELDEPIIYVESNMCEPFQIRLDDPDFQKPNPAEYGTPYALVHGMAAQLARLGIELKGCLLSFVSTVPGGAGLSSSAAFEVCAGSALLAVAQGAKGADVTATGGTGEDDTPFGLCGSNIDAVEMAKMAQQTESVWFGKPCGLMDQIACALGGLCLFDFRDKEHPQTMPLAIPESWNRYRMFLVDCGCGHEDATDEYAQVAIDMADAAGYLGVECLREISEDEYLSRFREVRTALGDRVALRVLHFYREQRLVRRRVDSLRADDMGRFVTNTMVSGVSSAEYLQNVSVPGKSQAAMVALALARTVLDELCSGDDRYCDEQPVGAARIHGGGFGGTVQVFVKKEYADVFEERLEDFLGRGSVMAIDINPQGIAIEELEEI